jgi:hypoxanthine phosphoribosyltransferase
MFHTVSWAQLHSLSYRLAERIQSEEVAYDAILAIARGGMPIASIMVDVIHLPVTSITISTYQQMSQQREPAILFGTDNLSGKRLLIVDDIADSGDTLIAATDYARQQGAVVTDTATLFYKPHSKIVPTYYSVTTADWVIFPFELAETVAIYQEKLASGSPDTAELKTALQQLGVPGELLRL